MHTNYTTDKIYEFTFESIDFIQQGEAPIILSKETINNILGNIQFNYLLIIFTMGCFTSLLFCQKKPTSQKKFIIIPSYNSNYSLETDPILAKV